MLEKFLFTFVFLAITIESARSQDYGPFSPNEKPKRYPVIELARRDISGEEMEFSVKPNSVPLLKTLRETDGTRLVLFDDSGKVMFGPISVSPLGGPLSPPGAYRGDLNRDGKTDYIVEIYSGGVGIANGYTDVVFIVSSNGRYEVTVFRSVYPGEDYYVDLFGDGRFQYIQPTFVDGGGVKGKDGKSHNYWVYNIHSLQGASFKLQNSLKTGFPRWIMYAGHVNHRPTEQLTDEQKQQLWKPHERCLTFAPDEPCSSQW